MFHHRVFSSRVIAQKTRIFQAGGQVINAGNKKFTPVLITGVKEKLGDWSDQAMIPGVAQQVNPTANTQFVGQVCAMPFHGADADR